MKERDVLVSIVAGLLSITHPEDSTSSLVVIADDLVDQVIEIGERDSNE